MPIHSNPRTQDFYFKYECSFFASCICIVRSFHRISCYSLHRCKFHTFQEGQCNSFDENCEQVEPKLMQNHFHLSSMCLNIIFFCYFSPFNGQIQSSILVNLWRNIAGASEVEGKGKRRLNRQGTRSCIIATACRIVHTN